MTSLRLLFFLAALLSLGSSSRLRCQCSVDNDEDNVLGITCSRKTRNEVTHGNEGEVSCSKDVSPFYYLVTVSLNSTMAARYCKHMLHARLAVPRSLQQVQDILPLFKRHPVPPYSSGLQYLIIGFYFDKIRLDYVTVEGDSLEDSGYTRWGFNQPNRNGEECGAIDSRGKLHDIPCREEYPFICQVN